MLDIGGYHYSKEEIKIGNITYRVSFKYTYDDDSVYARIVEVSSCWIKECTSSDSIINLTNTEIKIYDFFSSYKKWDYPSGTVHVSGVTENAFDSCDNVKAFQTANKPDDEIFAKDGVLYRRSKFGIIELLRYPRKKPDKVFVIPYEVNSLRAGAFKGCEYLQEIVVSKKCCEIYKNMFKDCRNLKKVVLTQSVSSIGDNAFNGCKSLETIEFPDSLRRIYENAFSGCKSLKTVTVPKEIYYIADSAFATGNPDFVLCGSNRVAKKYAKKNNINYQKVKRKRS